MRGVAVVAEEVVREADFLGDEELFSDALNERL